jgi:hypothetical protein
VPVHALLVKVIASALLVQMRLPIPVRRVVPALLTAMPTPTPHVAVVLLALLENTQLPHALPQPIQFVQYVPMEVTEPLHPMVPQQQRVQRVPLVMVVGQMGLHGQPQQPQPLEEILLPNVMLRHVLAVTHLAVEPVHNVLPVVFQLVEMLLRVPHVS